jgi:hypothetical protein
VPPKAKSILRVLSEQQWIEAFQTADPCLFDELVAAYVARGHAALAGAPASAIARGDDALERIKSGRAQGTDAWTKATVAIRRFSEAYGAATGVASGGPKRGRALSKRYGYARAVGTKTKVHIGRHGPGTRTACGGSTRRTSGESVPAADFAKEAVEYRCARCEKKLPAYLRLAARKSP